jgi:hypothetical protein
MKGPKKTKKKRVAYQWSRYGRQLFDALMQSQMKERMKRRPTAKMAAPTTRKISSLFLSRALYYDDE